ncbi:PHP domain-containing protein [Myxococcota bacterium]|nr:PHP domain-containing protein [Myxococcota bacterium]
MPLLRGNLHTHSTLSDGAMTPEEVLDAYRARGYDFVAFTDHRMFLGPGRANLEAYWAKLPKSTPELVVLYGVEEEPDELGGRHLGVIHAGEEELRILNHPSEYGLSIREVGDAVARVGAHSVEITCHGRYLERYDSELIAVPKIATDDSHYEAEIGVSWIEVDAERDPISILQAVKAGRFRRTIGRR